MIIYDRTTKRFFFHFYIEKQNDDNYKISVVLDRSYRRFDYSNRDLLFFEEKILIYDPSFKPFLRKYCANNAQSVKILTPMIQDRTLLFNDQFIFKFQIIDPIDDSHERKIINHQSLMEYKTGLYLMEHGIGPIMNDFFTGTLENCQHDYTLIIMQRLNMGTLRSLVENIDDHLDHLDEKVNALVTLFETAYKLKYFHDDPHGGNIMFNRESSGEIKAYFIDAATNNAEKDKDVFDEYFSDFKENIQEILEVPTGTKILSDLVLPRLSFF